MTTATPVDRILRIQDVLDMLGISRACLTKWRSQGHFPQPMQIGPRLVGWRASTVEAWIDAKGQG